jgi:hypothetical protein
MFLVVVRERERKADRQRDKEREKDRQKSTEQRESLVGQEFHEENKLSKDQRSQAAAAL